jgi:hypothetical protein
MHWKAATRDALKKAWCKNNVNLKFTTKAQIINEHKNVRAKITELFLLNELDQICIQKKHNSLNLLSAIKLCHPYLELVTHGFLSFPTKTLLR